MTADQARALLPEPPADNIESWYRQIDKAARQGYRLIEVYRSFPIDDLIAIEENGFHVYRIRGSYYWEITW